MKRYILTIILIIGSLNSIYGIDKNVIFAEVFYDSPENENITINPNHNGEYVKIKNVSNYPVDISFWSIELSGDNHVATFSFPANTILSTGKVAIICYQFDASFSFNSLFPNWQTDNGNLLFYHRHFFLSNKGNTLLLYNNDNRIVIDKIIYGKDGLYAHNGEGKDINLCKSIHRISVSLDKVNGVFTQSEYQVKMVNPIISNINVIIPSDPNGDNFNPSFITRSILTAPMNDNSGVIHVTPENAIISTQYFDGLGRKIQTVNHNAASSSDDLVDYIEYNNRGKADKQWLPVIGNGNGSFTPKTDVQSRSQEFYNGDSYAYSEAFYENSVACRPIESKAPGITWHNATGVTTEYLLNNNSRELQCVNYCVDHATGVLRKDGVYSAGQLYVMSSTDEDGGTTYQFVNKNDSTILIRQFNDDFIDTHYIYDCYGNLRYVLPPMATEQLKNQANGVISDTDEVMDRYAYIYKYDYRNRCVSKKLPGVKSIYMVYDRCDLLTYVQDGNQRSKNEWTYFVYDDLGRMAYSGIVKLPVSNNHAYLRTMMKSISPRTSYNGGALYGYSSAINSVTKENIKIVNYYDNYEFLDIFPAMKTELSYSAKSGFGTKYVAPSVYQSEKGLLTGSICKMLDVSGKELVKAIYYDDRGQVVQSRESNHLDGFDKKFYNYSFTGKPLTYRHENSTADVSSTEEYAYTYDNMDRLLETKHGWYDKDKITLVGNSYNDLGQLSNRAINGKIGVGYSYNIRGWVNSITCPKVGFLQNLRYETKSNGEYGCLDGNICEMSWRVKDPTFGADNITRTYDYTYDNVDRLLAADYKEDKERNGVAMNMLFINAPDYSTSYTYDLNSNITSLNRKGLLYKDGYNQGIWVYGTIDSLKYQREGNKLLNVSDMAHSDPIYNGAFNFNDYNDDGTEYEYDANGNITQDYNKGIAWVEYNYLNLPAVIRFTSGQVIEYVYDATGVKRSAIYKVQPEALFAPIESVEASTATAEHLEVQSRKDYCDNHIYNENGALTMVLVDNGYIESDKYYFYITDYQGNNRVVIDQDGVTEQVNHYYPYGGIFGEGLASSVQPYKFGGKELDRMNGLDWSDFGARMLDSSSGLWGSIDPMADKYHSISPYAYCAGNPILYVDPNGEELRATTNSAQAIILNTINATDAHYVAFGNDGKIDKALINSHASNSGNFQSLQDIVNSEHVVEVNVANSFIYKTETGEVKTREMGIMFIDNEFDGGSYGLSTKEVGFSGITQTPGESANKYNSTSNEVKITINSTASIAGQSQTLAHELYGHASLFVKGQEHKHIQSNMNEQNKQLYYKIINSVLETINNMQK